MAGDESSRPQLANKPPPHPHTPQVKGCHHTGFLSVCGAVEVRLASTVRPEDPSEGSRQKLGAASDSAQTFHTDQSPHVEDKHTSGSTDVLTSTFCRSHHKESRTCGLMSSGQMTGTLFVRVWTPQLLRPPLQGPPWLHHIPDLHDSSNLLVMAGTPEA